MEFANIAEFRQNAAQVFERLERSGEVVVLKNGRPIGLVVAADASTLDTFRVAAQRARAQLAATRLRRVATHRGLDRLSPAAANELIRKARRERTSRR